MGNGSDRMPNINVRGIRGHDPTLRFEDMSRWAPMATGHLARIPRMKS
jgi:hypothetical protein